MLKKTNYDPKAIFSKQTKRFPNSGILGNGHWVSTNYVLKDS